MMTQRFEILSLNIGLPKVIGMLHGEPVRSGIAKKPAPSRALFIDEEGIEGDGVADLSAHGGRDKAVYAYPRENWDFWKTKGFAPEAATFGENLTLAGGDENEVSVGDRFRWGDVVLEISQPRAPCYKLGMHTGRPDAPKIMTSTARCGWYLRVVSPGRVKPDDRTLVRIERGSQISVKTSFEAAFSRKVSLELRRHAYEQPALSDAWKRQIEHHINSLGR
jgi:MOSC domain-containing protein YiiM